uniref:UPAR/Ly6 domain-containing protein n=1 Tax=Sphaeramia orbicularis TaxID=375764 RepID=A0A673AYP3_9TELE
MHLFLLFSWIVLFPRAYTLKCNECITDITGKCNTYEQCPSETDQCTVVTGGVSLKSCASAHLCINGSLNTGRTRQVITSKCCNTDLCNDQLPPEPVAPRPNGKKCFTCDKFGDCIWNLDCVDNEDYCFSAAVDSAGQEMTRKGCTTTDLCLKAGKTELLENIAVEVSCCQGDYCNGAGSTGGSLLFLVVTVVSMVIPS